MTTDVFADLRWKYGTGIGVVQTALLKRMPASCRLVDMRVDAQLKSPFSPWLLANNLRKALSKRPGVFWSPGFFPPASSEVPVVVTVHDLAHLRFYTKAHAFYYNTILRRLYHKCSLVVCVSEFAKQEFLDWSRMDPSNVVVIPNALTDAFTVLKPRLRPTFPYVLYAGNRRPYKNITRLIRSYAVSRLPKEGVKLVLTGKPDSDILSMAGAGGAANGISFAGDVDDSELVNLYGNAKAISFVSLYEGFGLPILEGMALGIPVLTSNVTAMPEVAGGAAELVDPYSVEAIAAGLERVTFDEVKRQSLIAAGKKRLEHYSWDQSADRLWTCLRQLCS